MIRIGLEDHADIIIEALRDYRKWWEQEFAGDDTTNEMLDSIDKAIEFVRGDEDG